MIDMYIIKKFLNGEVEEDEFYKNVNETFQKMSQRFKEYSSRYKEGNKIIRTDANDYIKSALEDLESIKSAGEDEILIKEASICDMCNNLAHASKLIKDNNVRMTTSLFSLKTNMIRQIVKECKAQENECYGISYDIEKDCETFTVDIPACGQISWHLGGEKVECKMYDFEKDKTDYRNCDFLNRNISYSEIKEFPKHTQKVMLAIDNEEMNKSLYRKGIPTENKALEEPII